jgi:hypothetical protein
VVIVSRNQKRAQAALRAIGKEGAASWIGCDVASGVQVETFALRSSSVTVGSTLRSTMVAAAAVLRLARATEESWRKAIDGYLTSVFLCMRYEIPLMMKNRSGVILNNSSVAPRRRSRPRSAVSPKRASPRQCRSQDRVLHRAPSPNRCRSRNPRPSHSQCHKIEPHPDRCNGRSRSFHRSRAHRCRLVPSADTPHQVIIAGGIARNQGITFPCRTATTRGEASDLQRQQNEGRHSHPTLSSQA